MNGKLSKFSNVSLTGRETKRFHLCIRLGSVQGESEAENFEIRTIGSLPRKQMTEESKGKQHIKAGM